MEECEGKKQGWMIAGISTIGLTAVGVGVNIAQASKSRNLSNEIDASKEELARREADLNRINDEISDLRAKKNAEGKCCGKKNPERCCDCRDQRDGDCPGNDEEHDYSKYELNCKNTVFYFMGFVPLDVLNRLNEPCKNTTGEYMEQSQGTNGSVRYECKDYKIKAKCNQKPDDKTCPDITYAWPVVGEPYASKISAKLEEYKMKCEEQQGGSFEFVQATTGTGEIAIGGGKAVCKNRTTCDSNEETEVNIDVEQEVVNPVPPVNPKKDCRTSYGKKPTTDCPCDGDKGLKLGTDGTCQCEKSGETWKGGKCVSEPLNPIVPIPPKPLEPEYDEIDLKNCRLSGGEWKYRAQYKRWECFCGINQSGSDKNMVQTVGFKTCACKKDYIYIDDNDHSKGCKRGISEKDNADLNKITNLYGKFEKLINSMDTKAGQAERAAIAAGNASNVMDVRKYADQAKGYFDEVDKMSMEASGLYDDINALISGLNTDLRQRVLTYKQDADRLNNRLTSIINKARNAASEAEKAAVAQENLAKNNTCTSSQC